MSRASKALLWWAVAAAGGMAQVTITTPSPLTSGYAGFPYQATLSATTNPAGQTVTWSIVSPSGTPPGTQLSSTGVISGSINPADSGTYTFIVQAAIVGSPPATKQFSVGVITPQISITGPPSPLPGGVDGQPYSVAFSASNNTPFGTVWATDPSPPGLTMSSAGVLSGIPTGTTTSQFVVTAAIPNSQVFASQNYVITEYAGQVLISTKSLPLAVVGQPYSGPLQATPAGVTWQQVTLSSPAPPGIGFNAASGTFIGAPTATGTYAVAVQASYPSYLSAQSTFPFYVTNGPLSIVQTSLPGATISQPYQTTLTASGGLPPFTWSISDNIGLTITPAGGVISGSPTATGTATLAVTLTDSTGTQVTAPLSLSVTAALSVVPSAPGAYYNLPGGAINTSYSQPVTAQGGLPPYTWGLAPNSAPPPPGLAVTPTGVITGSPTTNGFYVFTVQVTDAGARKATGEFAITIGALTITNASLPDAAIGVAYSQTLTASGGTPPYTWALLPGQLPPPQNLPAGLVLDPKTGAISGTPTGPVGLSTFVVNVTDSTPGAAPLTTQKLFTVNTEVALTITTTSLPNGNIGVAYSQTLAATGGRTPYTLVDRIRRSAGQGVSLTPSTGIISGTPTASGQFTILAVVQDAGGQSAQQRFAFTIGDVLTLTAPSSVSATVGTAFSQPLTAAGGTSPYSFAVTSGTLPVGLSLDVNSGIVSGTPTTVGTSAVTFTVTDQRKQTAMATVTFTVSLPATPPLTFTIGNATQPPVTLCLGGGFPVPVTANLTVAFQASSAVATGTDTSVQFATPGTGSTVSFTVPACGTTPPTSAAVTMGTVAGTITISADLTAGGTDITPSSLKPQTMTVAPGPPVIQSVTLTPGSGSVTVTVIGYSTTREVASGNFQFSAASGSSLTQSNIPVTLGTAFTTWYTNASSNAFGSQFKLTIPFTVSANASSLTGVTATLTNSQGTSAAVSSQ